MASVSPPQAIYLAADKALNSLETAETMIESIRLEVNRYWDKISLITQQAPVLDSRSVERELDNVLESHDKYISTFYRSISHISPAARQSQPIDESRIPHTKAATGRKRNRLRQMELQASFENEVEEAGITAVDFPRRKRPKRGVITPDLLQLQQALSEWIKQTSGEFQIISKQGQSIVGRPTTAPTPPGQTDRMESHVIPPPTTTPSFCTSLAGSRNGTMVRTMSYQKGHYEVKATIKGVVAFSFLVEASETDPCGQVSKISCSNVGEASSTNVWVSRPTSCGNTMAALTQLLTAWVEDRRPSVSNLLTYLATYVDLFKTNCCSCNKWLVEDGPWGPLPPLCNVSGPTPNARKHFSCAPM